MARYIDADALIKSDESYNPVKWTHEYGKVVKLDDIKNAPTADVVERKKGEWIPCSERLPKYDDWQIVTIKDESGDRPYVYTDFGWYLDAAKCWIVDAEQRIDVVAWMLLPEPYKEGANNGEIH